MTRKPMFAIVNGIAWISSTATTSVRKRRNSWQKLNPGYCLLVPTQAVMTLTTASNPFADKIKQASTVADEIHSRSIEATMLSAASQWFRYATAQSKTRDAIDPAFLDFNQFLGWIRDDVKAKCIFYRREQPAWVDSDSTMRHYTRDPRHDRYIAENIDRVIRPDPPTHKTGQDVYLDDFS